eukprot:3937308-Alexandrium_andersonii.AAC.1
MLQAILACVLPIRPAMLAEALFLAAAAATHPRAPATSLSALALGPAGLPPRALRSRLAPLRARAPPLRAAPLRRRTRPL